MKINIYHTNDIHGNYVFLKRIHAYMRKNKKESDLYLDGGDFADLQDVIVQADQGCSAFDMFMTCGIDGMAIGNNEVDLGYEAVTKLAHRNIPFICANVTDNDDRQIDNVPASRIYQKAGKRFLVIGISPFYREDMTPSGYNIFSMMGNLKFHPSVKLIRSELEKNKGKFDYCILLSHSGNKVEKKIMEMFPEISLCLGGHSHSVENYKGYSQSGKGEFLGRITLETEGGSIAEIENVQIELTDYADRDADKEFDEMLAQKKQLADGILSSELEVIGELGFDPFGECELNNFICDCLMKKFDGDLAIMHAGIAEGDLKKPVSRKSLVENFPSKLNPTIYNIKGECIARAIQLSFDEKHIRESGNGAGFRGHVLGTLGYSSNVKITKNPFNVKIDGVDIEPDREYRLITDDYLQRGTGYPSLKVPNDRCSYDKWFIRELVQHFLTDKEVFESAKIRRIE